MSNYEFTYILRPLEEANLNATNERISTLVKNAGGELVARNDWGRRRLAYPIRKISDGYYTTLFITMPGTAVRGIERALKLNDDVLRFLAVKVEEFRLPQAQAPSQPTATQTAPAEPAAPAPEIQAQPAPAEAIPAPETATVTSEG